MSAVSPLVSVVDYGAGNLRSVCKALERSGLNAEVASDSAALRRSDAVVLPGVGAFRDAMESLASKGLDDAVREAIASGRPYLGLCLGLQVLFEESDEHGRTAGLAVLPGRVERFPETAPDGTTLLVPHIGWNQVRFSGDHPMVQALPEQDTFYFVHSYRAVPAERVVQAGTTEYGAPFASAVASDSVFAVQFHPEKSQSAGKRLLDAFASWLRSR